MISRETERFCGYENHDYKKELRSSNDLPTAFQKSEGKELCMVEGESNRMKETCANPLSNPLSDSLSKKIVIPTGIQDGHKDDTSEALLKAFAQTAAG